MGWLEQGRTRLVPNPLPFATCNLIPITPCSSTPTAIRTFATSSTTTAGKFLASGRCRREDRQPGYGCPRQPARHYKRRAHDGVYAGGVHPNDAGGFDADAGRAGRWPSIPRSSPSWRIGLDYYWDTTTPISSRRLLRRNWTRPLSWDLPMVIHRRDAHDAVRETIAPMGAPAQKRRGAILRVPFLSGDLEMAAEAFWLADRVVARRTRPFATRAHLVSCWSASCGWTASCWRPTHLYLTPHPHRGKRNEPTYILSLPRASPSHKSKR